MTYQDPAELWELYLEYKQWVKENPYLVHDFVGKDAKEVHKKKQRPESIDGFYAWHYETTGKFIHQYFENTDGYYDDFMGIVRAIKSQIRRDQIDGATATVFNQNIVARLNSLVEKQEVKTDLGANLPDWMKEE